MDVVVLFLAVVVGVSEGGECSEAHGHELNEEEHKNRHEGYAFSPVVVRCRACEAGVREGIVGRSEEVDEGGGYYDAGAKVFRDEECPLWDSDTSMSSRVDWESGPCSCQQSSGECVRRRAARHTE